MVRMNRNRMKTYSNNLQAFFALLRAGLWEKEVSLSEYGTVDYAAIMRLAEEQSVVGLITTGLEKVKDVKIPQAWTLQFIGSTLQIEQRNKAMNEYVRKLFSLLRKNDIFPLLIKGQGIAQCYERPLWRACGDVDLLFDADNYEKAKAVLIPLAEDTETEYKSLKHLGLTLKGGYVVELHGLFHSRLSSRVDTVIDEVQENVFCNGGVREWDNEGTTVSLPSPDNDIIFVFTHILKHFYIEGIGLRQICDWCRLLWKYRSDIDVRLLESRLWKAGLMSEWKAFGAFAVKYLGMPVDAMPLFSSSKKCESKSKRILDFVLETGNFGHNREIKHSGSFFIRKIQGAWFKLRDFIRHARIFPIDSVKFFFHYAMNGLSVAKDMREDKK